MDALSNQSPRTSVAGGLNYFREEQGNRSLLRIKNLPLENNVTAYNNCTGEENLDASARWPFGSDRDFPNPLGR
jgi:hypothetical protein